MIAETIGVHAAAGGDVDDPLRRRGWFAGKSPEWWPTIDVMGTTPRLATTSPAASEHERARRLELLLDVVELLERPETIAQRVGAVLRSLVGARLCDACGVVGIDGLRESHGRVAAAPIWVAQLEAERAARAGGERRRSMGGFDFLAVPLEPGNETVGAHWWLSRRIGSEDRELMRRVADRLARAADEERRRVEQLARASELRRSDALKTALLRGVTHEMRTPLTGIANAADALRVIDDPSERAELLGAVIGETERLERVVANLLDLSRFEGGVLAARMEWCVLEELVGAGLQAASGFLEGVEVVTDIADDSPLVHADPVLTERILTNLLHNAVRHGAPPVTVAGAPSETGIELTVCDAGGGVDPRVLPGVFEPFVHREGVGLGLGLPLCTRLAEAQGARLEHRARTSGGAAFAIVFPFGDPPSLER